MSSKATHYVILGFQMVCREDDDTGESIINGISLENAERLIDLSYKQTEANELGCIRSPMNSDNVLVGFVYGAASVYDGEELPDLDLEGMTGLPAKLRCQAMLKQELGLDVPVNKIRLYMGTAWR